MYFDSLSFLEKYIVDRSSSTNIPIMEIPDMDENSDLDTSGQSPGGNLGSADLGSKRKREPDTLTKYLEKK
ncbi:hypothetical protein C0J52_23384 [Blattella germanica]|nr:hypothetical protein C0J52_23384 [Blattella germanica]